MKKILLILFSTALLFGCSSSDDDVSGANTSFNPPAWIQGRWIEQTLNYVGYKFTNNDFVLITGTTEISIGGQIKSLNDVGGKATINEEINSSTEYKFSYTTQSITQHFHFVKVSNTKIKDQLNDPNGYNPYVKK